jgi:MADS-box transcription factor
MPPIPEPPRIQVAQEYQPPAPVEPKPEPLIKKETIVERVRQPLLLDTGVKKHKGSIFTPIDENRSILSQHLAAFHSEPRSDASAPRSQSIDNGSVSKMAASPPNAARVNGHAQRNGSIASIPETTFTPPSRSNSLHMGGTPITARPRLKVQIPDEPSDEGSATAESSSPRGTNTDTASQPSRRPTDSHSSGAVLPPPSPSASALLSAGASGPPNPFARPLPSHQSNNMNIDTPVSALPSRYLTNEFLPSPSSFYPPEWNYRGNESNTLPSPLNFATPVAGIGPSFLREDPTPNKRKSPDISTNGPHHEPMDAAGNEPKRVKVDS